MSPLAGIAIVTNSSFDLIKRGALKKLEITATLTIRSTLAMMLKINDQ